MTSTGGLRLSLLFLFVFFFLSFVGFSVLGAEAFLDLVCLDAGKRGTEREGEAEEEEDDEEEEEQEEEGVLSLIAELKRRSEMSPPVAAATAIGA